MQRAITPMIAAASVAAAPQEILISDTELRELFDLVDLDHSGEIDIDELCALFGKFGPVRDNEYCISVL
jgi:Ca2+-binding EF-hand superfamily protein